jgi:hypothetical protein
LYFQHIRKQVLISLSLTITDRVPIWGKLSLDQKRGVDLLVL